MCLMKKRKKIVKKKLTLNRELKILKKKIVLLQIIMI